MENIGGGRPIRTCGICGHADDHPRCLMAGTHDVPGPATEHHYDCGRNESCATCVAKTSPDAVLLRGAELLAYLERNARR